MSTQSATIVQRLWNYCNVLRDDGVSYGDYVEQLTYLLFLKMDDEQRARAGQAQRHPGRVSTGHSLLAPGRRRAGKPLPPHPRPSWARAPACIPVIFRKAQNKIQDPAKLRRLVELIDGETWIGLDIDVKGEIYEGLLEKNAQDTKSGRRAVLHPAPADQGHRGRDAPRARADHLRPGLRHRRLPAGRPRLHRQAHYPLDRDQRQHLRHEALHGWEIVDSTARLCVMNLYLHGIGGERRHEPHPRRRQPGRRPRRALRHGADQSALRQEEQRHLRHR